MALADFYNRNAIAASQVLAGFDEVRFKAILEQVRVGIVLGENAADSVEARHMADLLVRLLARVYPTICVRSINSNDEFCNDLIALARKINPNIELALGATVEVVIGDPLDTVVAPLRIYLGSEGWTAFASAEGPQRIGTSSNPFGSAVAACLGAANVFRAVFQGDRAVLDRNTIFTIAAPETKEVPAKPSGDLGELVLVGCGAIGNATAWALSRVPLSGLVHLVDHECIDLGNLQRYVLADRSDEGGFKADVLSRYFSGTLKAAAHQLRLEEFLQRRGHSWPRMLLGLDSARLRRFAQASLPAWIANAWTQPGDLGVSNHDFLNGACVNCLYLPEHAIENEDQLIAKALGVPEKLQQVRTLLHNGEGVPMDLLSTISTALNLSIDRLLPFQGRPIRSLYVEGFCGGAVIALGANGMPRQEVHVPLAHQSALAGVLLAAEAVKHCLGETERGTTITRIDVMRPVGSHLVQPAQKDPRGICICQDSDYRERYQLKYQERSAPVNTSK